MLRRTHLNQAESIDMLRELGLKRMTAVITEDGERLGVALRFVHRPIEDVNPELKLYRSYLVVQSIPLGGPVYVPTLFIGTYDPAAPLLTIATSLATIQGETWNREPDFVVRGKGVLEELPF
ncbi:MAG: hypothetical protein R6X18_15985 [Chloroflexota bacterium]|jgi:hypothetical protein